MKRIGIFWPVFIVLLGLLLIGGSIWIYKTFSEKDRTPLPKIEVSKKMTMEVNLYFASADAKKLVGEKREILKQPNLTKDVREVIEELIRGPRDKTLSRTFPPQTKLRSLYIDFNEAIAYVDFTEKMGEFYPGGSANEILSIYSLSNSIVSNFTEIKAIKILVNGEESHTLSGHIDITRPIGFNEEIILQK